jgi:guanosine-3',5'-bis(diphosphate) 3'-pyrophosphohydrolase
MIDKLKTEDFKKVFSALSFAAYKHRDQRRKDVEASPYINHPIALAQILVEIGQVTDVDTLCAAILHDTIEDTSTTSAELRRTFGKSICEIVLEVTDDASLPKAARKRKQVLHAPHASVQAKLVKIADKISNLSDMARGAPVGWPLARTQEYFDWASEVVQGLRGVNSDLEDEFDRVYAKRPAV